jgi:uncharacterized protein (DUF1501 family)
MERRKFLKITGTLGLTTPVMVNNSYAWASAAPLVDCDMVNDRALVIVRMAGANDGLNTIIPLSQYSEYSSLRPNIKLANTGANSIISLNSSIGIHPSMSGFANLLSANKLAVFNGVGYPTPNYSHFTSENTMFSGKDGTTNALLNDGMMGRYLEKVFPGMAGSPNRLMEDPVSLHFGNSNPCQIFGHTHNPHIEYNATSMQGTLFGLLAPSISIPDDSDYGKLQEYLRGIEKSMDSYYNRILAVFNLGNNSSTAYPNSNLGKQLRTVARLIKGGSKTKVFLVTIGGFDTHESQVQTGNTHLGGHANLLADVSNSITAFQTDIEALGIGNKITTVTFSEFGRQVKENDSTGTDHGNIAPFFVIGQNVNGGIYGTHPSLSVPAAATNNTAYYYPAVERKFDYRQIYATLLQDWLGADATVMAETKMDATGIGTTAATKIPNLISSTSNAFPDCLKEQLVDCHRFPYDNIVCSLIFEANGWSYYGLTGTTDNNYYFAIEHKPTGTGANTNTFVAQITIRKCLCSPSGTTSFAKKDGKDGSFVMGVYWNIKLTSGTQNGFVNIRFFHSSNLISQTLQEATTFKTSAAAAYISPELWFKTLSPLNLPNDLRAQGLFIPIYPLGSIATGSINGVIYKQWGNQANIDGNSGGMMIRVTNETEGNFVKKPATPPYLNGTMRFNQMNSHFEGFDGFEWIQLDN